MYRTEHTYIHTYLRTYVYTYIRTYVRTYVRTYELSTLSTQGIPPNTVYHQRDQPATITTNTHWCAWIWPVLQHDGFGTISAERQTRECSLAKGILSATRQD